MACTIMSKGKGGNWLEKEKGMRERGGEDDFS